MNDTGLPILSATGATPAPGKPADGPRQAPWDCGFGHYLGESEAAGPSAPTGAGESASSDTGDHRKFAQDGNASPAAGKTLPVDPALTDGRLPPELRPSEGAPKYPVIVADALPSALANDGLSPDASSDLQVAGSAAAGEPPAQTVADALISSVEQGAVEPGVATVVSAPAGDRPTASPGNPLPAAASPAAAASPPLAAPAGPIVLPPQGGARQPAPVMEQTQPVDHHLGPPVRDGAQPAPSPALPRSIEAWTQAVQTGDVLPAALAERLAVAAGATRHKQPMTTIEGSVSDGVIRLSVGELPAPRDPGQVARPPELMPPPRVGIDHPQWAEALGERLVMAARRGIESARISLNPEHLGQVEIEIRVQSERAQLWLNAQHPQTREALELALPRLRDMLAENGLGLERGDVSADAHSQRDAETAASEVRTGHFEGDDEDLPPAPQAQASDRLLDDYA